MSPATLSSIPPSIIGRWWVAGYKQICWIKKKKKKNSLTFGLAQWELFTVAKQDLSENSLGIQWLRLCTPITGGLGSIPDQGTRSHMPQLRPYATKEIKINIKNTHTHTQDFSNLKATEGALPGSEPLQQQCIRSVLEVEEKLSSQAPHQVPLESLFQRTRFLCSITPFPLVGGQTHCVPSSVTPASSKAWLPFHLFHPAFSLTQTNSEKMLLLLWSCHKSNHLNN